MTWTAYMDANVLAASKDPKDLQQTPAQSRTAYLDANVHAASMDTKDLKQTPTQYRTPAINANQLSVMDPTAHTKNLGHSRNIFTTQSNDRRVIVQGLRESGVFSSIVLSSQESISKEKFLASFESNSSSKAAASESLPSRKIGRNQHSQAARRF
ncbi:hypothetical protein KY290_026103 [Solanum tuberosum]|uniref:Uncharacterized protein n=1 Tax=Solanum tuberosum TaxID=4113 RepID=A0ABQ7UWJ8_SOLTU|nr:hypothetical protein KY284_025799 [Solanum tuberosum]KAH0755833.1 hypothetical protein KY290_026103 [Solanum tuberosum]